MDRSAFTRFLPSVLVAAVSLAVVVASFAISDLLATVAQRPTTLTAYLVVMILVANYAIYTWAEQWARWLHYKEQESKRPEKAFWATKPSVYM